MRDKLSIQDGASTYHAMRLIISFFMALGYVASVLCWCVWLCEAVRLVITTLSHDKWAMVVLVVSIGIPLASLLHAALTPLPVSPTAGAAPQHLCSTALGQRRGRGHGRRGGWLAAWAAWP